MIAFPANPYSCLKPGIHDVTLTSYVADVSNIASFPFVKTCQIDGLEGIEDLATIRTQLREISRKNERGRGKKYPQLSVAGYRSPVGART